MFIDSSVLGVFTASLVDACAMGGEIIALVVVFFSVCRTGEAFSSGYSTVAVATHQLGTRKVADRYIQMRKQPTPHRDTPLASYPQWKARVKKIFPVDYQVKLILALMKPSV